MAAAKSDKITCETPTPGKSPTRIDRWKFDAVRAAILRVSPARGEGVLFRDLPMLVEQELTPEALKRLGSTMWYVTTVKLHLETVGELARVPGSKPQRLLRCRK